MLDIENFGDKFNQIVATKNWADLQDKFNSSTDIYVIGHGGNLAVADHAAVDITRLSNGTKNAMCPGSGVVATSLINDVGYDQWMATWLSQRTCAKTKAHVAPTLPAPITAIFLLPRLIVCSTESPKIWWEIILTVVSLNF